MLCGLISAFNVDDVSHSLFAIWPENLESRQIVKACIPTIHINEILALAVARFDAARQSTFFNQISSHPWTKGSAGWIFENSYTFGSHQSLPHHLHAYPLAILPSPFLSVLTFVF